MDPGGSISIMGITIISIMGITIKYPFEEETPAEMLVYNHPGFEPSMDELIEIANRVYDSYYDSAGFEVRVILVAEDAITVAGVRERSDGYWVLEAHIRSKNVIESDWADRRAVSVVEGGNTRRAMLDEIDNINQSLLRSGSIEHHLIMCWEGHDLQLLPGALKV